MTKSGSTSLPLHLTRSWTHQTPGASKCGQQRGPAKVGHASEDPQVNRTFRVPWCKLTVHGNVAHAVCVAYLLRRALRGSNYLKNMRSLTL